MNNLLPPILMAFLATGAAAQEVTPADVDTPPPGASLFPEQRPADLGAAEEKSDMPEAGQGVAETSEPDPEAAGSDAVPEREASAPPAPERLAVDAEALAACQGELRATGASFDIPETIADSENPECGIKNPIQLRGLPGGIELKPAGLMRCETALALVRWTEDHVRSAAEQLPERGALVSIEQGSTYICRRRNSREDGKISEHAFGNAVDIMAFHFEAGDPIPVQPRERDGTMAEAFQDAVRATACLHFTTVLGPGTDPSHADHLHLDIKARNGGFRLCQ
ncbi:extensin family protein [Sulfitobacter sp. PS-8MA]|uniref:extensin family protein n=1 Tax=Sulfitobacter sp. PS-8MA TaxID=3237707 RepID=UPI0034C5C9E2